MESNFAPVYLNWIVFLAAVLPMIYLGLQARRVAEKDADGFLMGGRSLGWFVGSSTVVATGYSGWGFMGATQVCYSFGPIELLANLGFATAHVMACIFFATRLRAQAQEYGSLTVPEYIAKGHASTIGEQRMIQGVGGLATWLCLIIFIVGQIRGVGALCAPWLDISPELAAIIIMAVVIFYTAFGGLAAVSWTDTFMVLGMIAGTIWICIVIGQEYDLNSFWTAYKTQYPNLYNPENAAPYGVFKMNAYLTVPYAFMFAAILPYMAVRFMAFKDGTNFRAVAFPIAIMSLILSLLPVVGCYVAMKNPGMKDSAEAMSWFLKNVMSPLPEAIITLFILFSMKSTINSLLHTTSSALTHDMRVAATQVDLTVDAASQKKALSFNRWGVIFCGCLGLGLTYLAPPYFLNYFAYLGTGTLQAVLCGPVFLGAFWRGNSYGAVASMIVGGVLSASFLTIHPDIGWIVGPLLGDVFGCITYVVVSIWTFDKSRAPTSAKSGAPEKAAA